MNKYYSLVRLAKRLYKLAGVLLKTMKIGTKPMSKIVAIANNSNAKNCQNGVIKTKSISGMMSIKNIATKVSKPPIKIYFSVISNNSMKYVKPRLRRE